LLDLNNRRSSAAEKYGVYLNAIAGFAFETLTPVRDFASDGVDVASGERVKEIGRVEIGNRCICVRKKECGCRSQLAVAQRDYIIETADLRFLPLL
jgi:hypothetical protein